MNQVRLDSSAIGPASLMRPTILANENEVRRMSAGSSPPPFKLLLKRHIRHVTLWGSKLIPS